MRNSLQLGVTVVALFLISPASHGLDQTAVNAAIDRGVVCLRQTQRADGTWQHQEIGATSLAAFTLLECGVPRNDPAVTAAANIIRQTSIDCTHTYSIALSILFLDQLGDPADVPLIESLAVRLLAGQNGSGGWSYHCPKITPAEVQRLTKIVQNMKPAANVPVAANQAKRELTKEIKQQIALIDKNPPPAAQRGTGDNSNTQFATVALWVARRHGIPIDKAMTRVNDRYRASQAADGGWGYGNFPHAGLLGQETSSPAMTCAGLLGLAISHGSLKETAALKGGDAAQQVPNIMQDPAVNTGMAVLATAIGNPVGANGSGQQVPILERPGKYYYFLWSLERVGVAYGVKQIGGKDWYQFGAEILVANQQMDGSWQGDFANCGADTCFALLFLKRVNVARDLTVAINKNADPETIAEPAPRLPTTAQAPAVLAPPAKPPEVSAIPRPVPVVEKPATGIAPAVHVDKPNEKSALQAFAPTAVVEADAAKLGAELANAPAAKQSELLDKFRTCKGSAYAKALVSAMPKLSETTQCKARDTLAQSMTCLSIEELRQGLHDENKEIRIASAMALALNHDKTATPELIQLLEDREGCVARAAHQALRTLSGQDLGPTDESNKEQRAKAMTAWKAWYNTQRN